MFSNSVFELVAYLAIIGSLLWTGGVKLAHETCPLHGDKAFARSQAITSRCCYSQSLLISRTHCVGLCTMWRMQYATANKSFP